MEARNPLGAAQLGEPLRKHLVRPRRLGGRSRVGVLREQGGGEGAARAGEAVEARGSEADRLWLREGVPRDRREGQGARGELDEQQAALAAVKVSLNELEKLPSA